MKLHLADPRALLFEGDCAELPAHLPPGSVDAIVTDPPAGIGFMGRDWDSDKGGREQWIEWLAGVLRGAHGLLKPGGHALVWALPRTAHWTMTALEDAGFEVRDVVQHMFGTGFPKSMDVSKAIDKAAGAERKVVGVRGTKAAGLTADGYTDRIPDVVTAAATPEAAEWEGWGTALKPAAEFWILARKPLAGTVAANVLEHGTGALNIDGCRIGSDEKLVRPPVKRHDNNAYGAGLGQGKQTEPAGRWPANVVFSHAPDCVPLGEVRVRAAQNTGKNSSPSEVVYGARGPVPAFDYADADGCEAVERFACVPECAVRALDDQAGTRTSGANPKRRSASVFSSNTYGTFEGKKEGLHAPRGAEKGGASRFFYTAKVSRAERDHGCEHLEHMSGAAMTDRKEGSAGLNSPRAGAGAKRGARNHHPTVKPQALMRWLVRLITPPGGTVLDLFAGSGSTAVAALAEGFNFIGAELSPEYLPIAEARLRRALADFPPPEQERAAS